MAEPTYQDPLDSMTRAYLEDLRNRFLRAISPDIIAINYKSRTKPKGSLET